MDRQTRQNPGGLLSAIAQGLKLGWEDAARSPVLRFMIRLAVAQWVMIWIIGLTIEALSPLPQCSEGIAILCVR